ncbi:hypothetical protein [Acidovorax sp. CCYZU-2555]|uniref:hypothetical protein n=1 Tax=Acidovorax sp. CCYZU-2555 TaxID=2835042 RepID=UPI001BCC8DE0|nr:hypothetical protein [Acidovorax sp. CCYZU-2555]MBS7777512.1 hypothetical protein [Acidovorax sp. CCYZU-2555]
MAASNVSEGLNAVFSRAPLLSNTTSICLYTNLRYAKLRYGMTQWMQKGAKEQLLRQIFRPRNAVKSARQLQAALTFLPAFQHAENRSDRMDAGVRRTRKIAQKPA